MDDSQPHDEQPAGISKQRNERNILANVYFSTVIPIFEKYENSYFTDVTEKGK
jgi:hypothetical protein